MKLLFGNVSERRGFSSSAWTAISVLWLLTGLAAAAYHVKTTHDADTTTLGFLVFAFAGFLVPIISNLELPGGTKIQFAAAEVRDSATTLEQKATLAITDIAQMMGSFVAAQTRMFALFRRGAMDRHMAYSVAIQTLIDAMTASQRWLIPQPSDGAAGATPETVRVTLWRWDGTQLVYLFGTPSREQGAAIATFSFGVGADDYIGDAWRNARISNHATAPADWRALSSGTDANGKPYPGPSVQYGGVMFVPVVDDGEKVGMIEVDRTQTVRFDANAEVVASALANLVGGVLGHPEVRWGAA